ncbi:hypothetical protein PVAND_010856 [Polypedilum vanderplanki]|uniref:SFR19-like C-terminal domain-containing protein n=1 Tax=Polypedilum vanderplanki TaxID=319348 RepID=A0A9J6CGU0_POLVA|nr:hypothetical protein PVAND_010856 [Polypedilum vanderplanki]
MSEEKLNRRRSRTPCLDENRIEDESCADNSKEIELSDISDEDDQWPECNNKSEEYTNGNQISNASNGGTNAAANSTAPQYKQDKESTFKKITRSNRDRNYRDNIRRRENYNEFHQNRISYKKIDNSRRKEIERYDVRKVVASKDFSISRSRSRSLTPQRRNKIPRHREYFSPKRNEGTHRRSLSPVSRQKSHYSPISMSPASRTSSISPDRHHRNKHRRSPHYEEEIVRRSRSRHKYKSFDKTSRRKKHKDQKKHKKSRSKSKRRSSSPSLSPEPLTSRNINVAPSPSRQRQIMSNANLPQENIKIILKNDEAFSKRLKIRKRDKKSKKEKISLKDKLLPSSSSLLSQKVTKEQQQTKEVFASGDNILISVCFNNNNNENNSSNNNNNNNTNSNNEHHTKTLKTDIPDEKKSSSSNKTKAKKRQLSPPNAAAVDSAVSSASESYDKIERRQRKHKRKKSKRRHVQSKSSPRTPPMNPPLNQSTAITKRKSDMKPIAIIDLEKSPGKEVTQSPKEIIVLSDSDGVSGEGKKRDIGSKDIVIIEDTILEKGNSLRNHSHSQPHDQHSPPIVTPESPPLAPQQPVLKFALKTKSNILPFNLLHDQAEETEESNGNTNSNNTTESQQQATKTIGNLQKEQQQDGANNVSTDEKNANNQNDAYDPFEPTKSGSNSPVTPPPPPSQSYELVNEIRDKNNKLESLNEKLQGSLNKDSSQIPGLGNDDHGIQSSSLWNKKSSQQQPVTPPLPPSFVFSSSSNAPIKSHASLYDGIYGSDLKTPVVPSPIKQTTKSSITDKNKINNDDDDDDRTPYSPSSDGYDYEPPPSTSIHQNKSNFDNLKHSDLDTQSSEPSGSYSFERSDEAASKIVTTPLKLTTSTLKSFNSSMRSSGSGLQFVNKAELSIFENYLPASQQKSPLVKRQSNSSFIRAKMSRFTSSMNENGSPHRSAPFSDMILKPPVIDESILDDEVPNSAVDLVNKDKFLKKSLRIERVAEEVKLVLKPHYNKKHITKEEYKEILRKSVPKICHNKTGEINIQKITQLIEAYIKKVRYKRKAGIASSL